MNLSVLWYVLAGAILGFALSTLWEWLYYRSKRMALRDARIEALEAELFEYRDRDSDPVATTSYADGAARLETEEPESLDGVTDQPEEFVAQNDEVADSSSPSEESASPVDTAETDVESGDDDSNGGDALMSNKAPSAEQTESEATVHQENEAIQPGVEVTGKKLDEEPDDDI